MAMILDYNITSTPDAHTVIQQVLTVNPMLILFVPIGAIWIFSILGMKINSTFIGFICIMSSGFMSWIGVFPIWIVIFQVILGMIMISAPVFKGMSTPVEIDDIPRSTISIRPIPRSIIDHSWNCKNCGGPNPNGRDLCQYCGNAP